MFSKYAGALTATLLASAFAAYAADAPSSSPSPTTASAPAPASQDANANDKRTGSGPNPFSDCGIGAALFPNTTWAAVTSNVIWDVGTTAVTSATASPQTCSGKRVTAALFIRDTYEALAEETARGEGEHLRTVMNILECDSARHGPAIQATRQAMGAVVAQPGYASQDRMEKAAQFYSIIEVAARTHCSV